jgi:DNA-binding CsgD family transcriptional regulator
VHRQKPPPSGIDLSPQQQKLLRRFAQGKTDEEIARKLRCPAHLIKAQRQMLVERFQVKSQADLAAAARQFASWPKLKQKGD